MPEWLTNGMVIVCGLVVAVGYALVINMMATPEVWPFFALGFVFAAIGDLTLIALGVIGVAMALIYLRLTENAGAAAGAAAGTGDPLGDILDDYE
jgi:PTS system mannose-specific IIC component